MTEQLITFETAKLAKENKFGLDSYTGFVFDENGVELNLAFYDMENKYARPTQSLLQKWLREKYGIHVQILPYNNKYLVSLLKKGKNGSNPNFEDEYQTYEEALEKGLNEALRLIK